MMTVRPDVDAGRETAPGVVRSAALTSSPSSPSPSTGGSWLVRVAAVAVLYLMTAKIGFALAIDPGNHIAPVWLPSGIALGSLLLWGPRLWPGIWLGSFLANTWLYKGAAVGTTDVLVAMGLAVGSVLQARVGAGLLTRWTGGRDVFDRTGDLGTFGLVGIVVCGISSTLGVLTLCAAGSVEWATFGESWLTWWLGDVVGAEGGMARWQVWSPHSSWRVWRPSTFRPSRRVTLERSSSFRA
jgi:integral membrane sensor domain MASE1